MSNRHIKVINGRKYYYESIRLGKKVTSKYLGPVERIRKPKMHAEVLEPIAQQQQDAESVDPIKDDENYIG